MDSTDTARAIMHEVTRALADDGDRLTVDELTHGGMPYALERLDIDATDDVAADIVDVWLRQGMPELGGRFVSIFATCGQCGEGFCPADVADLIHIERADGMPCGGLARDLFPIL